MKRFGLATVVSLLCLLPCAVSAEGAWVLWKHEAITLPNTNPPKDGWGPVQQIQWTKMGVKSDRKDCETSLANTPSPSVDAYYVCFPDTIDPRGPKGK